MNLIAGMVVELLAAEEEKGEYQFCIRGHYWKYTDLHKVSAKVVR